MLVLPLLLLPLAAGPPPTALAPAVLLQEPEDLDDLFEEFRDKLKGKGEEGRCLQILDELVQRHRAAAERIQEIDELLEIGEGKASDLKKEKKALRKKQAEIARVVWDVFVARKRPTEPNLRLWKAAVYAYGQMGEDGPPYLWRAFEDKRFNRDVEFRALCVEQVGYTKDYSQWKELVDLLDYKDEGVIAAAGNALAQFGDAPGAIRRDCVEVLVKRLESYHNRASNLEDTTSARIYGVVREPMIRALSVLTGQNLRDPLDWTKWWNNNKNDRSLWRDR